MSDEKAQAIETPDSAASALSAGLGDWITTGERLPDEDTPVLVFYRGKIVIGERRWEYPTFEETFDPYWFWDDAVNDGQDWDYRDITHWMPLPETPNVELRGRPLADGPA